MRSIANASRESVAARYEVSAQEFGGADFDGDPLDLLSPEGPSIESEIEEQQQAREREQRVSSDLNALRSHFKNDDEVNWIIMGIEDGLQAHTIREVSGMTQTQHATAHRRFRRGLEKLFPDRRKSG